MMAYESNESIDRALLDKLSALSDEELREAVKKAAMLLGASEREAEQAAGSTPKIRAKLSSATDREIKRALSRIDEETVRSIAKEIGFEKGQG